MSYGFSMHNADGSTFNIDDSYANYHLLQRGILSVTSVGNGWGEGIVTFPQQAEPPLVFVRLIGVGAPSDTNMWVFTGACPSIGKTQPPVTNTDFCIYVKIPTVVNVEYLVFTRQAPPIFSAIGLIINSSTGVCTLSADAQYLDIEYNIKVTLAVPRYYHFDVVSPIRFFLLNDITLHSIFRVDPANYGKYRITQAIGMQSHSDILVSFVSGTSNIYDGLESDFPDDTPYKLNVVTLLMD